MGDGQAHWGAFEANGKTYGVIGNGVDFFYPKENYALFEKLRVEVDLYCYLSVRSERKKRNHDHC